MNFRLRSFGLHLLASAVALALIFGTLYFGWYRWPGWYLADVSRVVLVMAGVDIVVGPLLTFTVASPGKPRRELARDIMVIVAIQLFALIYGTMSVWNGRPLYYAFSENLLQVVQAYDIDSREWALARQQKPEFAPHWYSLPRWIWAPLPDNSDEANKIVQSAMQGGFDVTARPAYYKPWASGSAELRSQLKRVDGNKFFSLKEQTLLKQRMTVLGLAPDRANSIALTGRKRPLLVVFDPSNLRLLAYIKPT